MNEKNIYTRGLAKISTLYRDWLRSLNLEKLRRKEGRFERHSPYFTKFHFIC